MRIRPIEEADLEQLLQMERDSNLTTYEDADFGEVRWLNPWTLCAEDVLDIIRQRPRKDIGMYDTRMFVAEVDLEAHDMDGNPFDCPWLVGGFAYEIQEDGFEIVMLIVNPQYDGPVVPEILDFMKRKCERSNTRNRVTLHLRDRDEAGLRKLMPQVQKAGLHVRLAPDHFGDHDGWECTWLDVSGVEVDCEA